MKIIETKLVASTSLGLVFATSRIRQRFTAWVAHEIAG